MSSDHHGPGHRSCRSRFDAFFFLLIFVELLFALVFALAVDYGANTVSSARSAEPMSPFARATTGESNNTTQTNLNRYYSFYTDVTVMVYIGFGFLMTFASRYQFSGVGLNMLLASVAVPETILLMGFWEKVAHGTWTTHITLQMQQLIDGQFGAAAVLISMGAVLGKTTPLQLLVMAIVELCFYSLNYYIGVLTLGAIDIGGSMFIHAFGAYFGLACSISLSPRLKKLTSDDVAAYDRGGKSTRSSDTFAMIGTIFLWMFWPSFNGALSPDSSQIRVIVNTLLSLCACCVSAFIFSRTFRHGGKFEMVDIQNATLAGGVAVGSSADLVIGPGGAVAVGFMAGLLSTIGYNYLQPKIEKYVPDTCGVHNLHGMPGILGAVSGAIAVAEAFHRPSIYGTTFNALFPNGIAQVGIQFAALFITLGIAIVGGLLTGFLISKTCRRQQNLFNDSEYWEVPENFRDDDLFAKKEPLKSTSNLLGDRELAEIATDAAVAAVDAAHDERRASSSSSSSSSAGKHGASVSVHGDGHGASVTVQV